MKNIFLKNDVHMLISGFHVLVNVFLLTFVLVLLIFICFHAFLLVINFEIAFPLKTIELNSSFLS